MFIFCYSENTERDTRENILCLDAEILWQEKKARNTPSKNKFCIIEENENDENGHLSHRQKQHKDNSVRTLNINWTSQSTVFHFIPTSIMSGLIWTEFHLTSIWSEHNRSDRLASFSSSSPVIRRSPTWARDREDEEESARALGDYRVSEVKEERPEGLTCENYKKTWIKKKTNAALVISC